MTPEQWTTLVGQFGTAGAVIFILSKMVLPMFLAKLDSIIAEQKNTIVAINANTASVGALTERVARLEGIFDHATMAELPRAIARQRERKASNSDG